MTNPTTSETPTEQTDYEKRQQQILSYARRASRILRAARRLANELQREAKTDITLMPAYSWADSAGFAMYLALRDIVESNGLTYEQAKVEYVRDVGQALEAERLHRPIRLSVGTAQPSSMGPL